MAKVIARKYFQERERVQLICEEPTLSVQSSKDECDINNIVKKYLRTGELPAQKQGAYADLSELTDLQSAIHMVNDAEQAFMDLPAEIRRRFDNDPVKLVMFAQDPRNAPEAIKLGLATARKPAGAIAEPVSPSPAGSPSSSSTQGANGGASATPPPVTT